MLARFSRALIAMLMVAVMAGAAVAFSVGVQFVPRSTCNDTSVTYGSQCPSTSVRHIRIKGFHKLRHSHGRVHITITNHNSVPVQIKVVLVVEGRNGKIHRLRRRFTLQPGATFLLHKQLNLTHAVAARIKLTISDANGNTATIKRHFGRFR